MQPENSCDAGIAPETLGGMSAPDEYQRALEHGFGCGPGPVHEGYGTECASSAHSLAMYRETGCAFIRHVAQALSADPGVRAAVEREARAEAWDEGQRAKPWREFRGTLGLSVERPPTNPYRQEPSDA